MPLPLLALMLGVFCVGTAEVVIAGVLPEMSADLYVSIPTAGLLVTGYALGVTIGGPVITLLTTKWARKALLLGLMGVFIAGNVIAALAPNYGTLMGARVFTSLSHGTSPPWPGMSPRSCPRRTSRRPPWPRSRWASTSPTCSARPSARSSGSSSAGGPPSSTSPSSPCCASSSSRSSCRARAVHRERHGRGGRLPARTDEGVPQGKPPALHADHRAGPGAVFTTSTYLAPLLRDVGDFAPAMVAILLIVFGIGSVLGNILGGKGADANVMRGVLRAQTALLAALLLFWAAAPPPDPRDRGAFRLRRRRLLHHSGAPGADPRGGLRRAGPGAVGERVRLQPRQRTGRVARRHDHRPRLRGPLRDPDRRPRHRDRAAALGGDVGPRPSAVAGPPPLDTSTTGAPLTQKTP
ncbi:MFS transporter [Streptomyces tricolor]|nr:MFS transporter [Streptomyces tricolor]